MSAWRANETQLIWWENRAGLSGATGPKSCGKYEKAALDSSRLHPGEKEAIALAVKRKAMLIADDKEARYLADSLGLRYIGTAGVLLAA
jgi:hypothetical protein